LKKNPKVGKEILGKILLAQKARLAAKAAKEAVLRKGALEGATLPGKTCGLFGTRSRQKRAFHGGR
jgi:DNA gyrase subunit B